MKNPDEEFLSEVFKRQKQFCNQIDKIHIFSASSQKIRNNDVHFPFRQESSFHYLTGFPEADAIAIFEPNGTYTLFVDEKDTKKELWTGYRYGIERSKEVFKADKVYGIKKAEKILPKIIADAPIVLNQPTNSFLLKHNNKIVINKEIITKMRLIKSEWEIQQMRKASDISSLAHKKIITQRFSCRYEYQLEAIFRHEIMQKGARTMAYPAIVAGGANACTLHYNNNDEKINDDELVLVDAGCEWQTYASDITRTFPLREKFTPAQKAIYEIVLQTQQKAIESVSTKISMKEIHDSACQQITKGLIEIGLLKGSLEDNIHKKTYFNYFPHGIGHQLGLDVHDISDAKQVEKKLSTGMIFTIEPGIYLQPDNTSISPEFRGIGIRIEDNILVNAKGYENLTTAPKLCQDIER